jgi:anhydro-N-acetylmuramic acid kinase
MLVIGLMSGTSADGTDVAIVNLDGQPPNLAWQLLYYTTVQHPPDLRSEILAATHPKTGTVDRICTLNVALGEQFAQAALTGITEAGLDIDQIDLIGCHGQTVWHAPDAGTPGTLQLGEAAVIVERTGIPVANNFRARDMAAGGQGAPLVPYIDLLLLAHPERIRAAQNIGGIGNVTFLPPANRPDLSPLAFDTGPGNVLLDEAAARMTGGTWRYDKDGELASQGQVDPVLLSELLAQPYFRRPPPKSTGRELFSAAYAESVWAKAAVRNLPPEDTIATLTALTAHSIARAYQDFLPQMPEEVIVSGGGANNQTLMTMLRAKLAPAIVRLSEEVGIPGDAKEALAFAILAYETWHGRPGNLPAATGASRAVILGQITR